MKPVLMSKFSRIAALTLPLFLAAGCNETSQMSRNSRHYVPIPSNLVAKMQEKGMSSHSPILIRAYKKESELEVWKQNAQGQYELLKTYPMCRWSGQLGPKTREGDRQVPEGFYNITPSSLNPNSSFYLSFNVGYPNAYDRAYGRSGAHIMVHGDCSSSGCFSMTDKQIAEIYALTREAFGGGQKTIQMQSFPFRFSANNLAKYRGDANIGFWKMLKEGADHFEVTKKEPQVAVCGKRYVFNASSKSGSFEPSAACPPVSVEPSLAEAVSSKQQRDEQKVAELVTQGEKAVKRIYKDGDSHHSFKATMLAGHGDGSASSQQIQQLSNVSRPDALAHGPVEVEVPAAQVATQMAKTNPVAPKTFSPSVVASAQKANETTAAISPVVAVAPKVGAVPSPAATAPATSAAATPVVALASVPEKKADDAKDNGFLNSFSGLSSLTSKAKEKEAEIAAVPVEEIQKAAPAGLPLPPKAPVR